MDKKPNSIMHSIMHNSMHNSMHNRMHSNMHDNIHDSMHNSMHNSISEPSTTRVVEGRRVQGLDGPSTSEGRRRNG